MYISDEQSIINTQEILWVRKSGKLFGGDGPLYRLRIQYKNTLQEIDYESKEKRDETFNKLADALTLKNDPQ